MVTIHLDGEWQFRLAGKVIGEAPRSAARFMRWMPGIVPGTVHHHLHALGKIGDPHFGRNELELQWIDRQD